MWSELERPGVGGRKETHCDRNQGEWQWPQHCWDPRQVRILCILHSFRYGDEWTRWHTTQYGPKKKEKILELASDEEITSISGFTWNSDGRTFSLQAETSAGRSWGPHGNHRPYVGNSLRSSINRGMLRLNHISGTKLGNQSKYILR